MSKPYGLIIPNKKGQVPVTRASIFDEDSDSETPNANKPTGFSKLKRQDELNQQKAMDEDPTVYQYDEIYDDMETKKRESKLARKDIDRQPKYINRLLAAADRRKRDNERRIERQVQKEREEEGEEFKDKESFVTTAYKQKLEEMKLLDEQEKRQDYLESIGDVTKQCNLDGFYRHLYDQKVNYDEPGKSDNVKIKVEDESEEKPTKQRKYRSRKNLNEKDEEADVEIVEIKKEHLPSNLDADSDFSVDSSSDDEADQKAATKDDTVEHEGETLKLPEKGNVLSDNAAIKKAEDAKDEVAQVKEEPEPKKPKVDLWKKRTVGAVYDEAVQRYFERKSSRGW